ncbi:MAG: hypothetical protein ABSH22_10580 [Tepidisphaeraceae bacterium]
MFDEENDGRPERELEPAERAQEQADGFRVHAQLAAVFEGCRKFEAKLVPGLDAQIAREIQLGMGKLEKAKVGEGPVLPPDSADDAAGLLLFPKTKKFTTNDYHIHRRPGEVMIVRWLEGKQVDSFYKRLQAHFDVALNDYREEEKQNNAWKQDPKTLAYLKALDELNVKMAERYLRDLIRQHHLYVLSTQTADEMNILHLCDYVMGVPAADVVGRKSAPPEDATDRDLAWFFKLFSLRGIIDEVERMCFFTYLQKSDVDEDFGSEE